MTQHGRLSRRYLRSLANKEQGVPAKAAARAALTGNVPKKAEPT